VSTRNRNAYPLRPMTEDERKLVERHLRLVRHLAKRLRDRGMSPDDLYSAGCLGLCVAAMRFQPGRAKFSTYGGRYAAGYMRHEIQGRPEPMSSLEGDEPEARPEGRGERFEAVDRVIEGLPYMQRLVLRQRLRGLSPRGIARKLHCTIAEVQRIDGIARDRVRIGLQRMEDT
jgi:RNA polymerase sigma factor (sigma-70 family)